MQDVRPLGVSGMCTLARYFNTGKMSRTVASACRIIKFIKKKSILMIKIETTLPENIHIH